MTLFKHLAAVFLFLAAAPAVAQNYPPGACKEVPESQVCVDSTPCKTMTTGQTACLTGATLPAGAIQLPNSCWQYNYSYACQGPTPEDNCTAYENNTACSVVNSVCTDTLAESGNCDSWNYTYKCQTSPQTTSNQIVCSSTNLFNTSSFTTPSNANQNAINTALALEIGRETQVYGQTPTAMIFVGVAEQCTKGYYGLKNCCNATPGAQSDQSFLSTLAGSAVFSAVKYVGQEAVDMASPYVFDAMYSSGIFSDGLMESIALSQNVVTNEAGDAIATNFAGNGVTLGAYGFTYGTGTYDAASSLPGTMDLSADFGLGEGEGFIAFNPYVFVAMLILQEIESLKSCTPEEQLLAMHKGANLSNYNNEICAKTLFGSCLEYQDNYCSFNSVLAKIINIQGKAQLALDPTSCTGLTLQQVSQLNFSKMDFSQFTNSLVQQAQAGLPGNISGAYTPVMQSTGQGGTQTTTNGLAYPPASTSTSKP